MNQNRNVPPGAPRDGEALVTGATGFIGRRLALALASGGRRLNLLCRPASTGKLAPLLSSLPETAPRPRVVPGDLSKPDLGVGPVEAARLREQVTEVFHLAAGYDLGMSEAQATAVNVEGTRRVLQLARGLPRLARFHHMSSIAVSGDAQGVFRESDLDQGQGFPHAYGRSKYLSEREVRNSGLPVCIYRPGAVVGDSRTGEMDKVDGPYYLFRILHRVRRIPLAQRVPLMGMRERDTLFPLVPVDFVVAALTHLASKAPAGATFHLVDPNPLSYADFYEEALRAFGFRGPVVRRPISRTVKALTRPSVFPATRRLAAAFGLPAEMLPHTLYRVTYDDTQAREALSGSGIVCPPLQAYLPRLVDYFVAHLA